MYSYITYVYISFPSSGNHKNKSFKSDLKVIIIINNNDDGIFLY